LTPFQEKDLIEEHQFSFQYSNIPVATANKFVLVWTKSLDPTMSSSAHWHGRQILLIYASWDSIRELDLTLQHTGAGERATEIDQLTSAPRTPAMISPICGRSTAR